MSHFHTPIISASRVLQEADGIFFPSLISVCCFTAHISVFFLLIAHRNPMHLKYHWAKQCSHLHSNTVPWLISTTMPSTDQSNPKKFGAWQQRAYYLTQKRDLRWGTAQCRTSCLHCLMQSADRTFESHRLFRIVIRLNFIVGGVD